MNANQISYLSPVNVPGLVTSADFTRWSTASTGGVAHELSVPRDMVDRYIWIAADAPNSDTDALWYLDARLEFILNQAIVGTFPIITGASIVPGKSMNIYSPKSGSGQQPPLTVTCPETFMGENKSLLCPCFFFRGQFDMIRYRINAMSLGAGGYIQSVKILTPGSWTSNPSAYALGISGGGGSGLAVAVKFDGSNALWWMDQTKVVNRGSGYTSAPTVWHSASTPGASVAPTFLASLGGICNVVTGLSVLSMTPKG